MIGHHHKRRGGGQVFPSGDLDVLGQPENNPHPPPPHVPTDNAYEAALSLNGPKAFTLGQTQVPSGLVLPVIHKTHSAFRDNARDLVQADTFQITHKVKDGGGGKQEAVEAVEKAAVPRERGGPVFDAQITFD